MRTKAKRYIFTLTAIVLCACALLTSCSKGNDFTHTDGKYLNKKTNIAYYDAPACYEPLSIGEEVYGKLGDVELFEIVGADPQKWLCDASGTVFYAEDVTLPDVDEMTVSYAALVLEDVTLAKVTDSAVISELAQTYVEGQGIYKPSWTAAMYDINWRVRFIDETRGICYVLAYFELAEDYVTEDANGNQVNYGRRFIYNRFEDKLVVATDVLASYVAEYKELNIADED